MPAKPGAIPPLRYLDVNLIEHEGREFFHLSDPFGYVEDGVLMPPPAFMLAALFDGQRDPETVCRIFREQFGVNARPEDVLGLAGQLSAAGLLADETFEIRRAAIDGAFRESRIRPAWLAGRSYPAGPDALRAWLTEQFQSGDGQGMPTDAVAGVRPPLRALIAPHIDFARGGPLYARAYRWLWEGEKPDLVLLFGVAHAAGEHPFVLCAKDFETPLGTVPVARDAIARLETACAWDPYEEEILHRTEHSLEFQVLMLALLYGNDAPPIVPVLCGMLTTPDLGEEAVPDGRSEVARFLDAAQSLMEDHPRAVAIAGADLSHVGRRFGDDLDITPELVKRIVGADENALNCLCEGDPAGFYRAVMRGGNPRHVCGMGAIYATARIIGNRPFRSDYLIGNAPDPAGGIVTFAACAAERET